MHFGLFSLMAQRDRSVSPRQLYQEMVEQVKMAEQIGFDIAWFAEHHFSNYCLCPSPLAMAIALAPQTTKIRLGTAVIVAPLYHPLRMLEEIGMLDVISNGRAVSAWGWDISNTSSTGSGFRWKRPVIRSSKRWTCWNSIWPAAR